MHEEQQGKHYPDEIAQLLKTLIEVQLTGNELLASLCRKVDTAICVLENISRNTCETVNEIDALARCQEPAGLLHLRPLTRHRNQETA